jgi:hypothetical protein
VALSDIHAPRIGQRAVNSIRRSRVYLHPQILKEINKRSRQIPAKSGKIRNTTATKKSLRESCLPAMIADAKNELRGMGADLDPWFLALS